ncbi:glycosyltransferase family 4 protein [Flavivirga sp. 57AJ16]|uniref:glycosyltransferase family 4 protein n=1 Tax=Flavivirga sp. 57AJ16 TaxID=3025307 RepID=UPI0023654804|nr:glycosyltransferase family 4 protein [Flavivirga sp. 57AJ16]MDD7885835.1 glycosyltransferase family 4 protein [Flavivirga sp. 57AJ16]
MKKKIIRITTVPASLLGLLKGQLKFMSLHYDLIGISSNGGGILKEMESSENVKTIPVEMTRKITPFKDLISVYKLYKIIKIEKPYIVHTHTPKAGTLGMIAAKLAGVPHRLHTIAGLPLVESTGAKRSLLNFVEKITYSCATIIYPNSFGLRDIILDQKFTTNEKLKVIGNGSSNGIDTNHYNPDLFDEQHDLSLREELGIKPHDFVFVFVGRLVTDKGINELVEAFKKLNLEFKNSKLLLVGPYESYIDPLLPKTLTEIDTHKNIIVAGWQNDVRPFFSISDALVFPSYREGFPNVVLQAGAMELPCIVSNINGCNEIIENNNNGIIIPVKDTQAIYNSMKYMGSIKKDDLIAMGKKSRKLIISRFEQKFVWQQILKEYNALENLS